MLLPLFNVRKERIDFVDRAKKRKNKQKDQFSTRRVRL